MSRISEKDLEDLCIHINHIAGHAPYAYSKNKDGKLMAYVGSYMIDSAYGGHRLVQLDNKDGGIKVIIDGFSPKRELYEKMQAFLLGLGKRK